MPGPPPPPPPTFNTLNPASGDDGRSMLLQSIRAGKSLKKTVTNDKSAPTVSGKVKGESSSYTTSNNGNNGSNTVSNSISNSNNSGLTGLGGLFSSGMPKLKPTGLRGNVSDRDSSSNVNNSGVVYASIAHHSMKRGPPPVPPPAAQKPQVFSPQTVTDHASSAEGPKGFGKPMLSVPQKPSPPPKKLNLTTGTSVSRAQSMRLQRSPPVLAPTPQSLHQSQDCLNEVQPRPTNRILRPPIARPPSPPVVKMNSGVGGVTRAAPPPPSRVTVTAPCIPPPHPPLPLRPAQTHQRLAPPPPPPPTPPTRGSSMRNGHAVNNSLDLEVRFGDMFHPVASFPLPEPFRGFAKVYSSKNAAKQQAPAPPLHPSSIPSGMLPINISGGGKQWSQSAASLTC